MKTIDYASMTKKQTRALLEERGVTGPAMEAVLQETGKLRHAARVQAAVTAARSYAEALCRTPYASYDGHVDALAALLCVLDAVGVGGDGGVEGLATDRAPCFAQLGKGRKQASDGEAWSAAISAAQAEILGGARLVLTPVPPSVAWPAHVQVELDRGEGLRGADGAVFVDRLDPLAPWLTSLAREALRRGAGLPPWHEAALGAVELEDDVEDWAEVVNALADEAGGPPAARWEADPQEPSRGRWCLTRGGGLVSFGEWLGAQAVSARGVLMSVREHRRDVAAVWREPGVEGWVLSRLPLPAGHIHRCGAAAEYADTSGGEAVA